MINRKIMIQDMKERKEALNPSIYGAIFQNPYVRDLPNMAALRGMYSRFIVGEKDVYFAFGYDEATVYGDFIEARGSMIPESVVKKCGYFVPELDAKNVICLDCETRKLDDNIQKTVLKIISIMQYMDFYTARCMRHQIKIPMYYFCEEIDSTLLNFVSILDNKAVENTATKKAFWAQENLIMNDYAIPEWPIHPNSKRPGIIAFSASRYMPNTSDTKKISSIYSNPSAWNLLLKSFDTLNPWLSMTVLSKEWADYIIKGMDRMKIPCQIINDRKIEKNIEKENAFFEKNGLSTYTERIIVLSVNSTDYGAFVYWNRKYIAEAYFTDTQRQLGRQLYFEPATASYMFAVDIGILKPILQAFEKCSIPIGLPEEYPGNLDGGDTVWLNTEISNLPFVLDILNMMNTDAYHAHLYGMDFNSTYETRRYAKMRYPADHLESLYVTSNEPCYKGEKELTGRTVSMDGTLSEDTFTTTIDPAQTPKSIPISEALDSKLMIERREWRK